MIKQISRGEIIACIKKAIRENEFEYRYQPIFNVKLGAFTQVEQIISIRDKRGEYIDTAKVISIAEEYGLIYRMDLNSLKYCCEFIKLMEETDSYLERIYLNISVFFFEKEDFAKNIKKILFKNHILGDKLCIEITGPKDIKYNDKVQKNIDELMQLGIAISVDNYKIGYSNISRVLSIKFKTIKLEKSLVQEMENLSKAFFAIKKSVDLVEQCSKNIVIKGIENQKHFESVKELDYTYLQGFYFCKPLLKEEIVEFLKKKKI